MKKIFLLGPNNELLAEIGEDKSIAYESVQVDYNELAVVIKMKNKQDINKSHQVLSVGENGELVYNYKEGKK